MESGNSEADHDDSVSLLIARGATREQAIELLDASGGNVEGAMALLQVPAPEANPRVENTSEVASANRNAPSEDGTVDDEPSAQPEPASDVENPVTTTAWPLVEARLVEARRVEQDDYEELQEQLQELEQNLDDVAREDENVPMADVLHHEVEPPLADNEEASSSRMNRVALIVIILVIVGVVLGIVLPRRGRAEQTGSPTSSPTMAPTTAPTTSPIVSLTELLSSVSSDGGEALRNQSTAQYNALVWLAGNANLTSYSDAKRIQRYVLATLYYSLNGSNWTDTDGWLTDSDECDWYNEADDGPFCTVSGEVREFDVFHNNLFGTIPPEVGLLSNSLVEFGLADSVYGPLPSEIGLLTNLQSLWLYNLTLTGTIPADLYQMTSLRVAWLFLNEFSGNFTCPEFVSQCYVSCAPGSGGDEEACRTL